MANKHDQYMRSRIKFPTISIPEKGRIIDPVYIKTEMDGSQKWYGQALSSYKEPPRPVDIVPFDHPDNKPHSSLGVDDIERLMGDKIFRNARNDNVLKKEAWAAFRRAGGSDRSGLTLKQMLRRIQQALGSAATRAIGQSVRRPARDRATTHAFFVFLFAT